jgi:DNA polymerase-3 subunit beta
MIARDLKSIIKMVAPAFTGATLPICNCVHFSDDRIWSTNLEATIEVECDISGVVASIPHKAIKALLSSIDPKETIELQSADGSLTVRTTTGETTLLGLDVQDVRDTRVTESIVASAKIDGDFIESFHAVAVAASGDQSRQVLTGVLIEVVDGRVRLTATDSYRLHHDELPASTHGTTAAICPTRYVKAMPGKEPVALDVTDSKIRLSEGPIKVTVTMIDGSFPNYGQLRPSSTPGEAILGMRIESLERTLKTFERLADNMAGPCPIVLEFCYGERAVEAKVKLTDAGEHRCELALKSYVGDSLRIGFNAVFLRQAISFAGMSIGMTDEAKPAVITSSKGQRYALLMPVRLG